MIANLSLQHFRSYADDSFEFEPGVNIIVGPNASGKTNLLEAILVICRGGSFRAPDSDLIQQDRPWARLDAQMLQPDQQRTCKLAFGLLGKLEKTLDIDDKIFKRMTARHTVPVVLFEPNHLQLMSAPERRRNLLDDLLEQTSAPFATLKRNYARVLAQRNALLKHPGPNIHEQLFPWNIRLSELGGQLAMARMQLIGLFNETLAETYSAVAKKSHTVTLEYDSKIDDQNYGTALLRKLEQSQDLDQLRGFTGNGPHRDDMRILLDGQPLQQAASRGETRTVLLSLKIKEAEILETERGTKPLLLLDDVFGELDGKRRHALTEFLQAHQTFITTTDADVVTATFAQGVNHIALSS